jgi:hypothetical protein
MNLKKTILVTILAAASITANASIYTINGPVVNPANGHSYFLISQGTWSDSEAYAQTLGGHLASINDANENAWVYANMDTGDSVRNAWLGIKYNPSSLTYGWVNGDPFTYINWAPGEPNGVGGGEVGSFFGTPHPAQWNDNPNSDNLFGIVEVVPEPTTFSLLALCGIGYAVKRGRRAA